MIQFFDWVLDNGTIVEVSCANGKLAVYKKCACGKLVNIVDCISAEDYERIESETKKGETV
jgi:hypothetical protein